MNVNSYNFTISSNKANRKSPDKISFNSRHNLGNYKGCILGGALGDAFGAPLEKLSIPDIKHKFKGDLMYMLKSKDGVAEITDDTQMTLFTMDGLLNAFAKYKESSIEYINELAKSYKNWLKTQNQTMPDINARGLMRTPQLYSRREPGITCLSALEDALPGTTQRHINNSAGNGGTMRVAPAGLMYYDRPELAFTVGSEAAAITHGHPSGYLSAGTFAAVISKIIQGESLDSAIREAVSICKKKAGSKDVIKKVMQAVKLSEGDLKEKEAINVLGSGWTGDEALAIGLYTNLKHPTQFKDVIRCAANHGGDSDTTASIAGNIAGAIMGEDGLPNKWLKNLELRSTLDKYSHLIFATTAKNDTLLERQYADSLKVIAK